MIQTDGNKEESNGHRGRGDCRYKEKKEKKKRSVHDGGIVGNITSFFSPFYSQLRTRTSPCIDVIVFFFFSSER